MTYISATQRLYHDKNVAEASLAVVRDHHGLSIIAVAEDGSEIILAISEDDREKLASFLS